MNKELGVKELEQIIITGTQYCGYPKVAALNAILIELMDEFSENEWAEFVDIEIHVDKY